MPYEKATRSQGNKVMAPWGRDPTDLYMLYTGGTTGVPKGVMWPQGELLRYYNLGEGARGGHPDRDHVRTMALAGGTTGLSCAPLMHGTGAITSQALLHGAGTVVTLTSRSFDADETIDTIERERVERIAIVGDAFAKPILQALDARPGERDISSLRAIYSAGVMWSEETKRGLLRHHETMLLVDSFGSSEAIGMGSSTSTRSRTAKTARFALGDRAIVIDDDGNEVVPGSGQPGRIAVKGILPIGLLQGSGEDRQHVHHHRWREIFDPWRLWACRSRRHPHAAGSRISVHQHRRREGLPRGGRGSPEGHTTPFATPSL